MVYTYTVSEIPYAAIFGSLLGIFFITELETTINKILNFVKGWN